MEIGKRAGLLLIFLCVAMPGKAAGLGGTIGLPMSDTAVLGRFARGPIDLPVKVGAAEFHTLFSSTEPAAWPAEVQARQFFANGGGSLHVVRVAATGPLADALVGEASALKGLHSLEPISDLRLLIAPELSLLQADAFADAFGHFRTFLEPRRIFFILDPPPDLPGASAVVGWVQNSVPADAAFCAIYYPYLEVLVDGGQLTISACGAMAAIYAKNDAINGIWRSPAGTNLTIQAQALHPVLSISDYDLLNANHVDAIREFPGTGIVPFSARTLDRSHSENRSLAVVRTRNWIAASIERALAFAAVEDNGAPLWSQIRELVEEFLLSLFNEGAFVGTTPSQTFFVRCDATTTTAADIASHQVKVLYGVALLRANEFDITTLSAPVYDAMRAEPHPAIHVRAFDGDSVLAYPTSPGFNYVLEVSGDLQPNAWIAGGSTDAGDGAWRHSVIPMTADRGFYRLRIMPAR